MPVRRVPFFFPKESGKSYPIKDPRIGEAKRNSRRPLEKTATITHYPIRKA
jgi:hypothetical protein